MSSQPDWNQTLRRLLLPALAGAAGTGAASAYLSHKNHDPQESPGERRRRILRNAMYGTALGGVAGAALPAGAGMLGNTFFGKLDSPNAGLFSQGADRSFGFGLKHLAPVGVAGLGGWAAHDSIQKSRVGAARALAGSLAKDTVGPHTDKTYANRDILRSELAKPGGIQRVLGIRSKNLNETGQALKNPAVFRANEEVMASGLHPGLRLKEMGQYFNGNQDAVLKGYQEHLAAQDPLSKLVSRLAVNRVPAFKNLRRNQVVRTLANHVPGAGRLAQRVEHFNPSGLAEAYGRYVRPSVPGYIEAVPPIAKLGLLGGGVLGANWLQQKLMGQ